MSASANSRTALPFERVPSASLGRRGINPDESRQDRPGSRGELDPDDSASNVSRRRVLSGRSEKSGDVAGSSMNHRDTRTTTSTTTRETFQVRTRSPVKVSQTGQDDQENQVPSHVDEESFGRPKQKSSNTLWIPVVSLSTHTKAPLAGRVSQPFTSKLLPKGLEPDPLPTLTPEQQEAAILQDLLHALMGYEGQYIRFSGTYDQTMEKDRLTGPSFQISSGLDPSVKGLTRTISTMATHYKALEAFVEVQSREEFGTINHALCAAIAEHLKAYLAMVVHIEHQVITNKTYTLHQMHLQTLDTAHIMSQLYLLAREILKKNSILEEDLEDSMDGFDDVENILEQLREGGDLVPGGMSKKLTKGGPLIRLLTDRLAFMAGDPAARSLLQDLLRAASRPYTRMLNEWLHHGAIKDPHCEFLIREQQSIKREKLEDDYTDEYWEKRYTIRENDIPPQLEAVKEKVLLAGKYLNVVRECGGVDVEKEVRDIPQSFDDPAFLDNINSAYAKANESLLRLLLTTHALPERLRSLKHYFFLDRSDFFTYFLDLSASELRKPWRLVNTGKLQSLLDLALRQPGTVAAQDPFKEDVKVHMNNIGWTQLVSRILNVKGLEDGSEATGATFDNHRTPASSTRNTVDEENKMTGFEALEFRFFVPFPLSLVISSKTIFRYQILFRYLLSLRHLEHLLITSWEDHNKVLSWIYKSGDPKLEMWKRKAWTLRARMLIFIQQTTYYCTSEVIEPNWHALMARVRGEQCQDRTDKQETSKEPRTVDELMEDHVDFLDTCLKECMLMNHKLLKIQGKLFTACTLFATYTTSLSRTLYTLPIHPNSSDGGAEGPSTPLLSSDSHKTYLAHNYGSRPVPPEHFRAAAETKLDDLYEMLGKYEHNFEHHLRLLLDALDYYAATETVALGRLCAILGSAMCGREGHSDDT